jgi:hypothetical protein
LLHGSYGSVSPVKSQSQRRRHWTQKTKDCWDWPGRNLPVPERPDSIWTTLPSVPSHSRSGSTTTCGTPGSETRVGSLSGSHFRGSTRCCRPSRKRTGPPVGLARLTPSGARRRDEVEKEP